jgi:hypothetical protein
LIAPSFLAEVAVRLALEGNRRCGNVCQDMNRKLTPLRISVDAVPAELWNLKQLIRARS